MNSSISASTVGRHKKVINILDLPDEVLKDICKNCNQSDWICLSLVNKRFRELAAAHIYRNFHIVFPDEDDPYFDSPIDGLAGGLSTLTTSDYNHAKHLREISLDTLSVGDKAEAAYKAYLTNVSCGKFMNTLLLLALRQATSLDTFRWNIRVELDRPVYKALHNIQSLKHLHVRQQAGPSLYETPPPLPNSTPQHPDYPVSASTSQYEGPLMYGPPPSVPSKAKATPKWLGGQEEPPTIAGFRNLESLSVLDIDSLDIIAEIKICVRNSSSTLRKLKLSFSNALAMKARNPAIDTDPDESEDDDFQVAPQTTSTDANYDSGPAKAFRAQQERKAQESVLGRIFELEPFVVREFLLPPLLPKQDLPHQQSVSQEGEKFIHDIDRVFRRIVANVTGTKEFRLTDQQKALDFVVSSAKAYVASEEAKTRASAAQDGSDGDGLPSSSNGGESSSASGDRADGTSMTLEEGRARQLRAEAILAREMNELKALDNPTAAQISRIVQLTEDLHSLDCIKRDIADEAEILHTETADVEAQKTALVTKETRYTLNTRGIGLHSLSIHLVPIKPSVLAKAIDLHSLKQITLLNVGEQRRFWTIMMKENKLKPLSLRKVFTDDVCLQFLQLVSELDQVEEVFMLQRSLKHKPESLAPKPETTIAQIRKFVLKKHLPTLKGLMIKNEADNSWDVDWKIVELICRRGKALEELAVTMGMRAIHEFIRNMACLGNLRALQIVSFRTDDTCVSVIRETRRFIVDAISHHPHMKLEWLAIGDGERAVKIVRPLLAPKSKKSTVKGKGKEPATNSHTGHENNGPYPVGPVGWDDASDSEDYEDDDSPSPAPKLDLVEGFAFYDVYGVRIFKKEISSGTL